MEAHRADSPAIFARGQSGDAIEGVTSFLEKRPAVFPDRVSDGLPDVFPGWQRPRVLVALHHARAGSRTSEPPHHLKPPPDQGTP